MELAAAIEIDADACRTLSWNRPNWRVEKADLLAFEAAPFRGVELVAGGVPCPPFSFAGKQLGENDERDLFPAALRVIEEARPAAVLLENVRGFASKRFDGYRAELVRVLSALGYEADSRLLNSSDFGVPQLRPRWIMVAMRRPLMEHFEWPAPLPIRRTVGGSLRRLMAQEGWAGAAAWAERAREIAPTIVGGSRKHGGADLGPTRAKKRWTELGVDGMGIANRAPGPDFPPEGHPRLTIEMVARLQGFPASWRFRGRKTSAYRQVGNALPPPVARHVGQAVVSTLEASSRTQLMLPIRQMSTAG